MSIKAKALWLIEFYQQVADGGEMEFYSAGQWTAITFGPNMSSARNNWRIKPSTQIVDMSVCIASQIDCEFSDDYRDIFIGKLGAILTETKSYEPEKGPWRTKCRPRMSPHIHYWSGGECPLPEGVLAKAHFRDGDTITPDKFSKWRWTHDNPKSYKDIIGFEVMGLAEGWEWAE